MDDDGEALAGGSGRVGGKKFVDFAWWLLAWDRYALAAAATQQMEFWHAMQHKAVVAEIAADLATEGKSPLIAVIYDDLARFVCIVPGVRLSDTSVSFMSGVAGRASVETSAQLSTSASVSAMQSQASCGAPGRSLKHSPSRARARCGFHLSRFGWGMWVALLCGCREVERLLVRPLPRATVCGPTAARVATRESARVWTARASAHTRLLPSSWKPSLPSASLLPLVVAHHVVFCGHAGLRILSAGNAASWAIMPTSAPLDYLLRVRAVCMKLVLR